jgi:hypothetical protein
VNVAAQEIGDSAGSISDEQVGDDIPIEVEGDGEIAVPHFAVPAVLELVEIMESHRLEQLSIDETAPDELNERTTLWLNRMDENQAIVGKVSSEDIWGFADVSVPNWLLPAVLELIETLETEILSDGLC